MSAQRAPRAARRLVTVLLAAVLVLLPGLGPVLPEVAQSAPRLTVTSSVGSNKASLSGATTVTVSGAGYQSIKNAFGGIYVVFGYRKNASGWNPSKGGKAGTDFFYIADSQSKNNKGYQRFVAFPGSSTADSANGGIINRDGTFKLSMVIPGPTFSATTSSGGTTKVDCREVQCGIITFGAHGVVNGNNEAFTPVSFGEAATKQQNQTKSAPQRNGSQDGGAAGSQGTEPSLAQGTGEQNPEQNEQVPAEQDGQDNGAGAPPEPVTNGDATLGLEQQTVIAGRSLGFTGRGFAAGEQVVATLSSGLTAAGPIPAGQFGEIAGAVQVPADMGAGTHKIKLTGAGSGNSVETEFSVMADPAALAAQAAADTSSQDSIRWAMIAVIVAAALLFILVLSSLVAALLRRGKKDTPGKAAAASGSRKRPAVRKRRRKPARAQAKRTRSAAPTATVQETEPETSALDQLDGSLERESV